MSNQLTRAPLGEAAQADTDGVVSSPGRTTTGWRAILRSVPLGSSLTLVAFVVVLVAMSIWLGERFMKPDARMLDIHSTVPILLLGLAAVVALTGGAIDLSIASMATLATFLTVGLTYQAGLPFWLVLVIVVAVGIGGGLLNGVIVEVLHVNALIATLATAAVFLGASAVYSAGSGINYDGTSQPLPDWFIGLGQYSSTVPPWVAWVGAVAAFAGAYTSLNQVRPLGLGVRAWRATRLVILAVVAVVAVVVLDLPAWLRQMSWSTGALVATSLVIWALLDFTTTGRNLRAAGANRVAARLAGVRVQREVIKAFVISGVLATLAGVMLAANTQSASPNVAGGFLLPAFTCAFLSTVILSSGRFTVWGAILGGIFIVWIGQGLIIGGLNFTWTDVVNGSILIVAVALSTYRRRHQH